MQSPVQPETRLEPVEIEPGLQVHRCPVSGGVWIPIESYLAWRESIGVDASRPPQGGGSEAELANDHGRPALLCPESGRLMLRYNVGHGLKFQVDRSPVTGGIWLDRGEWEALKARGLHTELHLIFSASYQRSVRTEGYAQQLEDTFRQRIGPPDFERVLEFKRWLASHPRRRDISCFLADGLD